MYLYKHYDYLFWQQRLFFPLHFRLLRLNQIYTWLRNACTHFVITSRRYIFMVYFVFFSSNDSFHTNVHREKTTTTTRMKRTVSVIWWFYHFMLGAIAFYDLWSHCSSVCSCSPFYFENVCSFLSLGFCLLKQVHDW